jgi:hypothetical protein
VLVSCVLAAAPLPGQETADVVSRAMQDELQRSMQQLHLENLEKPYFIGYRVVETARLSVQATFGAVIAKDERRERRLSVELRVGSYDFDNTNAGNETRFPDSQVQWTYLGTVVLPLDDDYQELRRQIWLATDVAYKQALQQIAAKRAALQNKTQSEQLADFSRQEPAQLRESKDAARLDAAAAEKLVTELSGLFRHMPHVLNSSVQYEARNVHVRYVNSEGSSFERSVPSVRLVVLAKTQAADGMPTEDFVATFGRTPGDLPAIGELAAQVRSLGERLATARGAELLERYNGPVLFEGQAAAELVAQTFVPKLLAHRRQAGMDPRLMQGDEDTDFQDRIGARVLPAFMTVTDDATRSDANGIPLWGGYRVDDQGVPAQATTLVERGYLKTLLCGRTPVHGVSASTGSWRAGGVYPSNLFFVPEPALEAADLRRKMLDLVRERGSEFGVVVRRLGSDTMRLPGGLPRGFPGMNMSADEASPCVAASKLYPDGHETPLRNVEIVGLSTENFREIVAAGGETTIYTLTLPPALGSSGFPLFMGAGSGAEPPPATLVVPALLFEELTLNAPSGEIAKPPALQHPYFATKPSGK